MPTKMTAKHASSSKLEIDIQFASAAIENKVITIASLAVIKKWVNAAAQLNGLITLRFVNATECKKLNFSFLLLFFFRLNLNIRIVIFLFAFFVFIF